MFRHTKLSNKRNDGGCLCYAVSIDEASYFSLVVEHCDDLRPMLWNWALAITVLTHICHIEFIN